MGIRIGWKESVAAENYSRFYCQVIQDCTFLPELFLTSLEGIQVWISQKNFVKWERG